MRLQEYKQAIFPLSTKPDGTRNPIEVLGLGLGGEFGEVAEQVLLFRLPNFDPHKLVLELGDVLWYTMVLDEYYGLGLGLQTPRDTDLHQSPADFALKLAVCLGAAQDHIKKHLWHERPLDPAALGVLVSQALFYVFAVGRVCVGPECDLGHIAQKNVDKLRARWPQGFNPGGAK